MHTLEYEMNSKIIIYSNFIETVFILIKDNLIWLWLSCNNMWYEYVSQLWIAPKIYLKMDRKHHYEYVFSIISLVAVTSWSVE